MERGIDDGNVMAVATSDGKGERAMSSVDGWFLPVLPNLSRHQGRVDTGRKEGKNDWNGWMEGARCTTAALMLRSTRRRPQAGAWCFPGQGVNKETGW